MRSLRAQNVEGAFFEYKEIAKHLYAWEGAMADRTFRAGWMPLLAMAVVWGAHGEAAAREAAGSGEDPIAAAETLFTSGSGFEIIDLGVLPGDENSIGLAINNSGWVVGNSTTASETHAFLWRPGIGLTRIESPTSTSTFTFAQDINDLGVVLASSDAPFLWLPGHTFSLKGQLDGSSALNNRLDVAGSRNAMAAIWRRGQVIMIGGLGEQFSAARAINDEEVVAGVRDITTGERHPFLWREGTIHDLGTLPGKPMCEVSDISNTNIVVGFCSSPSTAQSFQFRNGALQPLPQPPTAVGDLALSINDQGFVVGADSTAGRAVGWTPNGTLVDLNRLLPAGSGWVLFHAHGINNRLEIVGLGQTPSGQNRAFLLRPR